MPNNRKSGHQIALRDRAHQKRQKDLKKRSGKVKRILHPSHEVLWHLFH